MLLDLRTALDDADPFPACLRVTVDESYAFGVTAMSASEYATTAIVAELSLTDDAVISEDPERVIYVPQGAGGGGDVFILTE